MSKADKMFEELGFEKKNQLDIYGKIWGVLYFNNKSMVNISFNYEGRLVCVFIIANDNKEQPAYCTIQELQAINEFCNEKGWLDVK